MRDKAVSNVFCEQCDCSCQTITLQRSQGRKVCEGKGSGVTGRAAPLRRLPEHERTRRSRLQTLRAGQRISALPTGARHTIASLQRTVMEDMG